MALLLAPHAGSPLAEALQLQLAELAASQGMELQVQASFDPGEPDDDLRVVVALPPDPGLAELAAAAPGVQFLALGIPGLQPGANLSVIETEAAGPERQGFLAGYLAAIVTEEWRVGVIAASDTPEGTAARQGFLNGAVFFCGLCRQSYPPFYTYPMSAELPSASSPAEWQAAAASLVEKSVRTVYVAPGAGDEDMLLSLAQAGVSLIGSGPPPAAAQERWIASVQADPLPALRQAWPDLIQGKGGARLVPTLEIAFVNPRLLSPGRQLRVEEIAQELQGGYIDTGVRQSP